MTNIAINGIGRIGKLVLKILVSNNFDVKYINELNGNSSNLLHSLEFDSVHGKWAADFKANNNSININEKVINTNDNPRLDFYIFDRDGDGKADQFGYDDNDDGEIDRYEDA